MSPTLSLHRVCAVPRRINADRSAMARDRPRMEHFEAVHFQQVLEARQRIVAQMLVIDRVVLQRIEEAA